MKKSYRAIAAITLASFFLTTILSDVAISQPLNRQINSDKLATPSNLDDIVMTDAQIMNNIALALYARLAFLNYHGKEIDTETLKTLLLKQKTRGDIRFERLNMEFYFEGLEAVLSSYFVVKCRVKIKNEPITRYALFSPFRGDDNGFPITVYTPEQIEEAYPGLGQPAARQSASGDKPLLAEYASGFTNLCGGHRETAPDSVELAKRIFGAYQAECLGWLNDANIEMVRKGLIKLINNIPADKAGAVITKALSILEEAGIGDEEVSITSGLRAILKAKSEGRDAGDVQLIKGTPNRDSLLTKYERLFKSLCHKAQYSEKAVSLAEIIFNAYLTKLRGNVDETTRQSFIDKLESSVKGTSKEDIEQSFELLAEAAINHSDIHDFDKDSIMNRLLGILNVKRSPKDIVEGFPIFNDRRGAPRHSASGSDVSPRSATPDDWERLRMSHSLRRLAGALNGPEEVRYLEDALYNMPEDIKTVPYLCAAREKNDDPNIRLAAARLLEEIFPNAFKRFVLGLVTLPGESENAIVYTGEALATMFCHEMNLYGSKFEYEISGIALSVLQGLREEGYMKEEEDGWIRTGKEPFAKEPGRASASGNRTSTESARKKIQDYLAERTDIDVSVTAKALMVPAKDVIRELKHAGFVHRGGNKYYKLVYDGPTYDLRKKMDDEGREGRESASGEAELTGRDYSVEVAALIGEGRPHAAADIVNGLYQEWKKLRQEDIESEASRMAGKSLREACLAVIKAQPLQRRQILKSEILGSEARRLLFVLGVSLSLSQKDRTGVPRKLLDFLFPLINSLKTEKPVTLNETIYLLKEGGMVWKDKNTNEWRMASIEGNYYLGVEELKAMRASLEFGGNLSERPTLTNPEAQKAQPPVILLTVSEAIGMEKLARRDRFTKVYEVLKKVSPDLAAKLQEVMKGIEGIIPDLGNRDLFNRIKALPVSMQEKEALSLAFEPGSEVTQAVDRRFSSSGAEDERVRKEMAYVREKLAPKVGVNVALPVQSYTVFASYDFLTDEEYKNDRDSYLYRFGLERILTDKQEKMVDWVIGAVESKKLNPKDVIVQLPKDFSDDKYRPELEKLEARGIKFMILNTGGLEKESKEARAEYRRNIYVMMLLARNINKDTLPESSLYRLLRFFVASHLEDFEGKEAAIDNYIDDIKNNNIAGMIKIALSYKPIAPYDSEALREEYNGVAKALVSA